MHYALATGTLSLNHKNTDHSQNNATALVNVDLLLTELKSTDVQVGEWVNVIGYVEVFDVSSNKKVQCPEMMCQVKAIMLWSAGAIKLAEYECALRERLAII